MWSPRVTGRVSSRRAHSCAGTSTILVLLRWGLNSTDYHSHFRNSSTVWTIPDSSLQQTASRVTRNLVADLSRILLTTTLTGIWGMDLAFSGTGLRWMRSRYCLLKFLTLYLTQSKIQYWHCTSSKIHTWFHIFQIKNRCKMIYILLSKKTFHDHEIRCYWILLFINLFYYIDNPSFFLQQKIFWFL